MELRTCTICQTRYTEEKAIINPTWNKTLQKHENVESCPKCLHPKYKLVTQ